jgi:hypothetical protein
MNTVLLKNMNPSHDDDQLQIKEGIKEKSIKKNTKHEKNICFKTEIFEQSGVYVTPFENEDIFIRQDIIKNIRFIKKDIKIKKTICPTRNVLKETKRPYTILPKNLKIIIQKTKMN